MATTQLPVRWIIFLGAVTTLAWSPALPAQLTWDASVITKEAKARQEKIAFAFKFKNKTDESITIKQLKTSCGCTTASLAKMTYAPGEEGIITASVDLRNRTGLQSKKITVNYIDASIPSKVLTVRVDIHEILKANTSNVYWKLGDWPGKKVVRLSFGRAKPDKKVRITRIEWDPKGSFEGELIEDEAGTYRVIIEPTDTMTSGAAKMWVHTDFEVDGKPFSKLIRVSVLPLNIKHPRTSNLNRQFPGILGIDPPVLTWQKDEPISSKVMRVTVDSKKPIHITSVTWQKRPRWKKEPVPFKFEVIEEQRGRRYAIRVTPVKTDIRAQGVLIIETDYKGEDGKWFRTTALAGIVRPPKNQRAGHRHR